MYSVGRRGKAQNYELEKQNLITTSGEPWLRTSCTNSVLSFTLLIIYMHMNRISLEKATAESEETARPRKRRRLTARGVQARHAREMSPVTPSNVHQRPQWCVTPLGRLIRPMRMRPARPIGRPLDVLKAQNKNISKSQGGKEGRKRRRTAASTPPTRARRLTIDPLRWGSTHISGLFLEGERVLMPPALDAGGETSGKTRVSSEVEGDEEVEQILDASQSPADDNDEPSAPPCSSSIPVDTTNADLAAEKATALRLLYSMFGEADEDWGGVENVDSDMERGAAATANAAPHASQSSSLHDAADFEVVPAAQTASKKSSIDQRQAAQTTAATTAAPRNPDSVQPPTATKLKDLFAPREEEGERISFGHAWRRTSSFTPFRLPITRFLLDRSPQSRLGARARLGPGLGRIRLHK
jgi:hypothetical protein